MPAQSCVHRAVGATRDGGDEGWHGALVWFAQNCVAKPQRKAIAALLDRTVTAVDRFIGGPYEWQAYSHPQVTYFVGPESFSTVARSARSTASASCCRSYGFPTISIAGVGPTISISALRFVVVSTTGMSRVS
jgi:hypothetical protein